MATRQTLAVVVNVADHGESDKIVTLFTAAHGKLTGIAKGAKRSKKRFVNKLEIFTLLEVQYATNTRSSLIRIDQASLVSAFPLLRKDYGRYAAASLICELILHWTRENDAETELFTLLAWSLEGLGKGQPAARTVVLFGVRMLDILGYQPQLSGCLDCGKLDAAGSPYRFSTGRSGMLCARCVRNNSTPAQIPLSLNTIKLLQKAQELEKNKLGRLQFSETSTSEAVTLLRYYSRHLLQRDLQSWNFLPKV